MVELRVVLVATAVVLGVLEDAADAAAATTEAVMVEALAMAMVMAAGMEAMAVAGTALVEKSAMVEEMEAMAVGLEGLAGEGD